ncbi:hypothetical protein NWE55_05465 [Myroides albus]|uniref:Uncharacterized protein n=1 Tax=Myroides albus TaxID=2562892 RepID=A0A6I3LHN2_9FLAO|nr:hypothetical protein [Myroides albus]MTG99079.1 hypothetical protein [Myroides albus]UVD80698.1 hypothetical protein NWE55_05465 [Myroides albus]
MKKLFMFLAVAGLATFGVSCSSDDNSSDSGKESKQLVLSADRVDVKEGDLVKFTVQADKKNVDGAKIYVDGVEAGIEHVFEKEGTFNVVAKKANFEDSAALKITVTKKDGTDPDTEKKTFTLVADKADVKVGETVTFSAKENNVAISGFKVKVVGGAELPGLTWKAEKEGVVKFIATKDGYNDTAEITVNVTKDNKPNPTSNFIQVGDKSIDLKGSAFFYFVDGQYVYSEEINGKWYVPFRVNTFTIDITETVTATDYDNSGAILFYVEQKEGETTVVFPWDVTNPEQILIASYNGKINGVDFKADKDTKFSIPALTTPGEKDARGTAKFIVEGNDEVSGGVLNSDYDGPYQAYFKIDLTGNGANSIKSLRSGIKVDNVDFSSMRRK